MLRMRVLLISVLSLCFSLAAADNLGLYRGHFEEWYDGWASLGPALIRNCSTEYEVYRAGSDTLLAALDSQNDPLLFTIGKSRFIHPLIVCMLSKTEQLVQVEVAVSSIILGLLPTILVFASSSCVEFGLLVRFRPILAFLLAAASPGLNPLKRQQYYAEAEYVLTQPGGEAAGAAVSKILPARGIQAVLVSTIEYLLALAAIANVAHNTWQLTRRTVPAFAPETAYQPCLWVLGALVGHLFEMGVMLQRVSHSTAYRKDRTWLQWAIGTELTPCSLHDPTTLTFEPEGLASRFSSWFCAKFIILFITWGTFFLSSTLFVKINDAMIIFVRYLFSVIVCRLILQYELDGLSLVVQVPKWMHG